jgi:hypothetical protein
MFFVSEVSVPFNTVNDIIKAYPDWVLMCQDGDLHMMTINIIMNRSINFIIAGNEINFINHAQAGDRDFINFVDRMETRPAETKFSSLNEGLRLLEEGRNVMHCFEGMLKGYFRTNPYNVQKLKVFAKEKARVRRHQYQSVTGLVLNRPSFFNQFDTLVFSRNSPVKSMFELASSRILESGAFHYLLQRWEGQGIPIVTEVKLMVLSGGQMILVFIVMVLSIFMTIITFCGEAIYAKFCLGVKTKSIALVLHKSLCNISRSFCKDCSSIIWTVIVRWQIRAPKTDKYCI